MARYRTPRGELLQLVAPEIKRGGEGALFHIAADRYRVAKVYHAGHTGAGREEKLKAMVARPPVAFVPGAPVPVAWPIDLLYESNGKFAGYTMPWVRMLLADLRSVFNPRVRANKGMPWSWLNSLWVAEALSGTVELLHEKEYVVGDLNAENVLVLQDYSVTIVDADSFQVPQTGNLKFFRCPVGKEEYTPPELQGARFTDQNRATYHDDFALAVLIFQILMDGYHPFTGVSAGAIDNLTGHCIRKGIFPYMRNGNVRPPPNSPLFEWLPPALAHLFLRAFVEGLKDPRSRPTARDWRIELRRASTRVGECGHYLSTRGGVCPWCAKHVAQGLIEPAATPVAARPTRPSPTTPPTPPIQTGPAPQPVPARRQVNASGRWLGWVIALIIGVGLAVAGLQPPPPRPTPAPTASPLTNATSTLSPNAVCEAAQRGERQAIDELRSRASRADALAEECYGSTLLLGLGVSQDTNGGVTWLNRATNHGNLRAMSILGQAYAKGDAVQRDCDKAFDLISRARSGGSVEDIANLGILYQLGCGAKRDLKQALELFVEGANKGDKYAMFNLAEAYAKGFGVTRNSNAALRWAQEAKRAGNTSPMVDQLIAYIETSASTKNYVNE